MLFKWAYGTYAENSEAGCDVFLVVFGPEIDEMNISNVRPHDFDVVS